MLAEKPAAGLQGKSYQVCDIELGPALQEDIERRLLRGATIKNMRALYVAKILPQPFEGTAGCCRGGCGRPLIVRESFRLEHQEPCAGQYSRLGPESPHSRPGGNPAGSWQCGSPLSRGDEDLTFNKMRRRSRARFGASRLTCPKELSRLSPRRHVRRRFGNPSAPLPGGSQYCP